MLCRLELVVIRLNAEEKHEDIDSSLLSCLQRLAGVLWQTANSDALSDSLCGIRGPRFLRTAAQS
jgi:hypothetical protein